MSGQFLIDSSHIEGHTVQNAPLFKMSDFGFVTLSLLRLRVAASGACAKAGYGDGAQSEVEGSDYVALD